ncbi:hypothetical protein [Rhodococcus sp. (in: high G+C Gram-positive bacteria)]|uniref:hypothetical protein n=1 Tax=Rhodococcus sp. TaxID=1831 RepID=UPI00388F9DF1
MPDLDSVADRLYGLDPGDFVSARDECAAEARRAGDRELTAAIGRLRKPTVAAWMVNLLARERKDDLAALFDLGDALRSAQRRLSGSDMRSLSAQRRKVVAALGKAAADLADDHGRHATESTLREVSQTLNAALADPDVADEVRAGRLASIVENSGFGDLSAVPLTLVSETSDDDRPEESAPASERPKTSGKRTAAPKRGRSAGASDTTEKAARDKAEREARQVEIDAVAAEVESARASAEQARSAAGHADAELERFDREVADLRRKLEHAEQQRQFARRAVARAKKEVTSAERVASAAETKLVRLQNATR